VRNAGFGLPTPSQNPQQPLPAPLLFELTDSRKAADTKNQLLSDRIFAFLSTETAGELQLGILAVPPSAVHSCAFSQATLVGAAVAGGVAADTTAGEMAFTPTMTPHDFSVPVFSVRQGIAPKEKARRWLWLRPFG
jgi:hypothetical protein